MATRLSPKEFNNIFHKVRRICVELVICNDKGTLMTLRKISPFQGMWHLPGGTVLYDESIEDAVIRVAQSELAVSVINPKLLGYIDWLNAANGIDHAVSLVFQVTPDSEKFTLDFQASEYQFFTEFPANTIPEYIKFFKSYNRSK